MDNPANLDKTKIIKSAQTYFREGQWDNALDEYEKILAIDKDDPDSLAAVGDIYAKKKSIQSAFEFYLKAAAAFLTRGQPDNAIQFYQKITRLDLSKLSADVRMNMTFFQGYVEIDEILKDKRFEIAIVPLGRLLKLRPKDPMAMALLKDLSGQIDGVIPSIQRYQLLADSFLKNGILEKAQELFKKIGEMDPLNRSAGSNLAKIYRKQGSDGEAKKVYLHLAELALTENDLDGAFEFVQKALELKSVEAGYILGLIHFKRQKWPEAKTEFENLLRIKVQHMGGLTHLAKTFALLGQPEKAEETFRKALSVDKDNGQVLEAWVEFCFQGKNKETALPHLKVLLEKAVTDNHAERTVKFSRLLIQLEPTQSLPRIQLIEALQTVGDLPGAADACRALSLIYEEQGQLNEAARYLEKALECSPADAEDLKKALAAIQQKNPLLQPTPQASMVATFIELKQEVADVSEPAEVIRFEEITAEEAVDSQPRPPYEPSNLDGFESQPELPSEPSDLDAESQPELPAEPSNLDAESQPELSPESSNLYAFESQPELPPVPPSNSDPFESQMATAGLCIQQGLLKAAIDIYQQILETKPDLTDVRKKLNEVNALYLQKWVKSKK